MSDCSISNNTGMTVTTVIILANAQHRILFSFILLIYLLAEFMIKATIDV